MYLEALFTRREVNHITDSDKACDKMQHFLKERQKLLIQVEQTEIFLSDHTFLKHNTVHTQSGKLLNASFLRWRLVNSQPQLCPVLVKQGPTPVQRSKRRRRGDSAGKQGCVPTLIHGDLGRI